MRTILLSFLFFATALGAVQADNSLLTSKRIVFLGDSITADRSFVVDLQAALDLAGHTPEVIALGLPSEGVTGLSEPAHPFPRPNVHERLGRVLTKTKPDLVVACYGINDGIYHPFSLDRFFAFQVGLQRLIDQTKASGAKLILLTPPPFDVLAPVPQEKAVDINAPEFSWVHIYRHYDRDVVAPYARWVLAQKHQVNAVVNLHTPISTYTVEQRKKNPDFTLSKDGIHLEQAGHRLMAQIIHQALLGKPLPELPADLLKFHTDRQNLLSPAWLSHVGHKRPQMRPGLPLAEAKARAAQIKR